MGSWSLAPLHSRAAYAPDAAAVPAWAMPPVWDGNGDEPAAGPNQGNNDYDQLPNWYEDLIGTDKFNPDTDGDGVTDSDEVIVTGTNPLSADSDGNGWTDYEDWAGQSAATADPDGDGANNQVEYDAGTNPRIADSDGDGLNDGLELGSNGAFNPAIADTDANGVGDYHQYYGVTPPPGPPTSVPVDSDNDGLHDDQEPAHGTSAADPDSDDDGLNDGVEVTWGSSPTNADSDGDGAGDAVEHSLGLLPNDPDTDNDGLTDGFEIAHNGGATYLPNDADSNDDGYTDYQDYTGQTLPPPPADGDSDGLLDDQEASHGTDAADADSDDDGLNDGLEVSWGSNPTLADTDADGVSDAAEYQLNLQPGNPDTDGDGLDDHYELATSHTNPAVVDTDEDGLSDYHEIVFCNPQTNPNDADTDDDFLTDLEEVNAAESFSGFNQPLNPTLADTDGDEISDYIEVSTFLLDTDGGGIPDRIERFYGLNSMNTADDSGDLDGDSWTNVQEYQAGHSLNADFTGTYDWDIDGMTNVWEIAHGLNPHDHTDAADDPDGDWSTNAHEFAAGTDPQVADSGNPGTTADGQPLVRGEGDSQAYADWDQDGTTNLEETLDDETNPSEPNGDTCECGGDACGCDPLNDITCGGAICNAPTCGCGGDACGCGTTIACGGTSPGPGCVSCECGGAVCTCANSASCNAPCDEDNPCSCNGSLCSSTCTAAGQCSVPCEPVLSCSCPYSNNSTNPATGEGAGTCVCADASNCSGGSCYTPDPCGCGWAGNGCDCTNEGQCSGDCYEPYECGCRANSCECREADTCNDTGLCEITMPCECYAFQNGDCSCGEASECNDDCGPCVCNGKETGDCSCQNQGQCPTNNCEPVAVESVEAVDSSGDAGERKSTSELQMVRKDGVRSAELTAEVSGPKPHDEPTWSGKGVQGADGSLTATFSGGDDSIAKAEAGGTSASVNINLFYENRITENKTPIQFDQISNNFATWLGHINVVLDEPHSTPNFEKESWNADTYDSPLVAKSYRIDGTGTLGMNGRGTIRKELTIMQYSLGFVEFKVNANPNFSMTFNGFTYDVSKPSGSEYSGSVTAALQCPITGTLSYHKEFQDSFLESIHLSGSGTLTPTLSSSNNLDSKTLSIHVGANDDFKVTVNGTLVFSNGTSWTYGPDVTHLSWAERSFTKDIYYGNWFDNF